jgi:mannose-6-phosphate isomerase-like protein (cupin superfamily)
VESIIDTVKILSELDSSSKDPTNYFIDFLHNDSFEAGILRLLPGQKDIQGPHSADELYFVIEGNGFIRILQTDHAIKKGSCISVPSNTKHHFHGNEGELVVLYVFNVSQR